MFAAKKSLDLSPTAMRTQPCNPHGHEVSFVGVGVGEQGQAPVFGQGWDVYQWGGGVCPRKGPRKIAIAEALRFDHLVLITFRGLK